jgi:hypothetical protein
MKRGEVGDLGLGVAILRLCCDVCKRSERVSARHSSHSGVSYYMVFEANLLTPLPSILSLINEIEDNLLLK